MAGNKLNHSKKNHCILFLLAIIVFHQKNTKTNKQTKPTKSNKKLCRKYLLAVDFFSFSKELKSSIWFGAEVSLFTESWILALAWQFWTRKPPALANVKNLPSHLSGQFSHKWDLFQNPGQCWTRLDSPIGHLPPWLCSEGPENKSKRSNSAAGNKIISQTGFPFGSAVLSPVYSNLLAISVLPSVFFPSEASSVPSVRGCCQGTISPASIQQHFHGSRLPTSHSVSSFFVRWCFQWTSSVEVFVGEILLI